MSKTVAIIIGVLIAIVAICGGFYITTQNSIVSLEERASSELANIGVQLERRADLIPNLVSTVKGFVAHEDEVIKQITDAREKIVNAQGVEEMSAANQQLTSALNSLNVIVENYPELKSSENFINLQDELAGTENRISTARKDYNDAVKAYNTKIKMFPSSIIAGMMNKEELKYFEVEESKTEVPTVNFGE